MSQNSSGNRPLELVSRIARRSGPLLVWSIWAGASLAAVLVVHRYTRNVPYMDDFALVPVVAGHQDLNLNWLWSQHNEHRPAISRLILFGLLRHVRADFRTGLYCNVFLLSLIAAGTIVLIRRLRGWTTLTDSLLPLSILNIGQADIWLIGFALNLVLSSLVSFALISVVSQSKRLPPGRVIWSTGLLLVLLPLCGGSGIVMLPPLLLWLGVYVGSAWWSGVRPSLIDRASGAAFVLVCLAIIGFYLFRYQKPVHHPDAHSVTQVVSTTTEYLSLVIWPNVPEHWQAAGVLVMFLVTVSLARLVKVYRDDQTERARASGLIAFILAMLTLALVVGLSRSALGPGMGLATRYIPIACPLLCTMYVVWLLYGPPRLSTLARSLLLVLVCLSIPSNVQFAILKGRDQRACHIRFEHQMQAGVPLSQLLASFGRQLYPDAKEAGRFLRMLKDARIGRYILLNDAERPVPAEASRDDKRGTTR